MIVMGNCNNLNARSANSLCTPLLCLRRCLSCLDAREAQKSPVRAAGQVRVCMLSRFSRVRLSANLWTVALQDSLFVGFSRQEYWSGLPCPSPGQSSRPRDRTPVSCISCTADQFFTAEPRGKPWRAGTVIPISLMWNLRLREERFSQGHVTGEGQAEA